MTNEEAIEMFSVAVTAELCERKRDLYRIAIKALEKQIPKKPSVPEVGYTYKYICPQCGCPLEEAYPVLHCPDCGQALDWSDKK